MDILIKISLYKLSVFDKFLFPCLFPKSSFLVGSVPINCTIDFGDGHRQSNGTNGDKYYTAYFSRHYKHIGQYNVSIRCFNELSINTIQLTRTVRRENMNRKMIIYKDLTETTTATRFNLISKEDFSFRHSNCLHLRNIITNEKMKLIWRKKTLEIIPTEVDIDLIILNIH